MKKIAAIVNQYDLEKYNYEYQLYFTVLRELGKKHNIVIYFITDANDEESSKKLRDTLPDFQLNKVEIKHNFDISLNRKLSVALLESLKNEDYDFIFCPNTRGLAYYSLISKKTGLAFSRSDFVVFKFRPQTDLLAYERRMISRLPELEIFHMEEKVRDMADKFVDIYNTHPEIKEFKSSKPSINNGESSGVDIDFLLLNDEVVDIESIDLSHNMFNVSSREVNSINEYDEQSVSPNYVLISDKPLNLKQPVFNKSNYIVIKSDDSWELIYNQKIVYQSETVEGCLKYLLDLFYRNIVGRISDLENYIATNAKKADNAESLEHPLVSVCITHYKRNKHLDIVLNALLRQTYDKFEVIVVDDGSDDTESRQYLNSLQDRYKKLDLKVYIQENSYLGAARNNSASRAVGKYIIFADDDNIPKETMVEHFVKAAEYSKIPILTCFTRKFIDKEEKLDDTSEIAGYYYPLGSCISLGVFENCFGDANAIIKKDVFEKIGGFSEQYGIGYEDWEFFLKATLKGYEILPVPEILFHYRVSPGSMVNNTNMFLNQQRVHRVIDEFYPESFSRIFEYAFSKANEKNEFSHTTQNVLNFFDRTFPKNTRRRNFAKKILLALSKCIK